MTKDSIEKVVLISGCSSGLGRALALKLAERSYTVYAGVRKQQDFDALLNISERLIPILLDVVDSNAVESAVDKIMNERGRLDILINNAAYSVFGGIESTPLADCQAQFDTNFFGCVRLIQSVLPAMRRQKSGLIINVGSVGGVWGQPLSDIYCASKFALEGLTESMSSYYRGLGINVVILEPGAIATAILKKANMDSLKTVPEGLESVYTKVQDFYDQRVNQGNSGAQTADEVADICIRDIIEFAGPGEMPVRFQCNKVAQPIFDMKLNDMDGLKLMKFTQSRMLN